MKLACFGAGYVGLVSSACFANVGHHAMCVDTNAKKIQLLKEGVLPIYESGLDAIVETTTKSGNLLFSADAAEAIEYADLLFIAVGTPPDENGSADLQYVLAVAAEIGRLMTQPKVIVTKSTVPVGTADRIRNTVQAELDKRKSELRFDVASNPEFLKEGSAVNDFLKPDRFIVGTDSSGVRELMQELYEPFNWKSDRMIFMDIRAAELTKYAANAMLATKISFMNEIANLAELLGTDIEQVRHGIGSDSRIGYQFIYPGIGYGGSCFPKDVRALAQTASQLGKQMRILNAVEAVNTSQKSRLVELIVRHYTALLDGEDVTWALRTPEVDANVSQVSSYLGVRKEMVRRQRALGARGGVVMVGRDIGTVVMPEAPLKLYIMASAPERARRRWADRRAQGHDTDYETILADVQRRDAIDSSRTHSPLRPAADAILIDSTGRPAETIVEEILVQFADRQKA